MAATSAILAGTAISTGYGIYQQNKAAKAAQKAQQQALSSRPDAATDQAKANQTALDAQALQRKRASSAQGYSSTILTGGQGVTAPPPATKTLLGM